MKHFTVCAAMIFVALSCLVAQDGSAPAKTPAAAPASAPAKAADGQIVCLAVTGQVQKGATVEGQVKWQPLAVGDVLDEMTIIRTGLSSSAVIRMADKVEARINSATKIGISEFRTAGGVTKTNLGLKYGTVRAHVDSSKGANDFRVSTPTATLSVTGSEPECQYSVDEGARGWSYEGHLTLGGGLGGGQTVNPGEGLGENSQPPTEGILGQFRTLLGDVFGGLDPSELYGQSHNGGGLGGLGGSTGPSQGNTPTGTGAPQVGPATSQPACNLPLDVIIY